MPIQAAYEIQCDDCFAFIGDRHDTREAAETERAELLTHDTNRGRWLCSDCAPAAREEQTRTVGMDPVHILGIAPDEPTA